MGISVFGWGLNFYPFSDMNINIEINMCAQRGFRWGDLPYYSIEGLVGILLTVEDIQLLQSSFGPDLEIKVRSAAGEKAHTRTDKTPLILYFQSAKLPLTGHFAWREGSMEIIFIPHTHIEQIPKKSIYPTKHVTLEKTRQTTESKSDFLTRPLPKPRTTVSSDSKANLGIIVGVFIGFVFTFSGIMSLASSLILAKFGINLLFGPGALVCGLLSIFSVFSFRKRKNKKGGLLLFTGLLIFIITIIISLFLESL